MRKLAPKQAEIYSAMTNLDWEFYEELPCLGLIAIRKNMSSIPDFDSWAYITIDKKGNLINGKPKND